jgi:hypothetical protein
MNTSTEIQEKKIGDGGDLNDKYYRWSLRWHVGIELSTDGIVL